MRYSAPMPAEPAFFSAHQGPLAPSFIRKLVWVLVALGAFSIAVSLAGRLYGGQIRLGGNSASTRTHEIVIANAVLEVPENFIRHAEQRLGGVSARLDLFALWPKMSGYAIADRKAFESQTHGSNLIFISVEPQQMSRDMSGRLEPIYRQLVEDQPMPSGFDGLIAYGFKPGNAVFNNETLYVAEGTTGVRFVARCIDGEGGDAAIAPCERDVFIDDELSVKYRFPKALLASFTALDGAVLSLVEGFKAGG